jgi:predicted small metal-binding protein
VNAPRGGYSTDMRVFDCDCGQTLQAANDDDLLKVVREHVDAAHEGRPDDDELRRKIEREAYEATDS